MQRISPRVHTAIGTLVGLALLLAPALFGFDSTGGAAAAIPRALGAAVILSEIVVRGGYSMIGFMPMTLHIATDVVLGAFLVFSPWIFGFTGRGARVWVPYLVIGLVMMAYALATRPNEQEVILPGR